ncbi:ATP-binding cassette domain-containing protein [Roseobacter sp. HKCCA0434]|uniref:thiamine ABC transporter ATP-binding protein n=1 Tax=Roseobacter sp. HKCCA0434 TaxID=3079297 RepID=UPI002905CA1C|nr:ATP-binding cassette domain-containing protein [Roseobacter sp. HKCCA0434]
MITFNNAKLRNGSFELRADFETRGTSAVIGPSGSGKSTLLMALSGFVPIVAGVVEVDGQPVGGLPPERRPVSILFQDHNLFAHLDVKSNVGIGVSGTLRLDDRQESEIARVLERVGLAGLERRKPAELSGGQQQRVAIARALLRERPVLLLDEPFGALGPGLRREMLDLVAEVAAERRLDVLMVTHEPEDAHAIAATTIYVDEGRAHAPRPTAELLDDPPPALAAYLGQ